MTYDTRYKTRDTDKCTQIDVDVYILFIKSNHIQMNRFKGSYDISIMAWLLFHGFVNNHRNSARPKATKRGAQSEHSSKAKAKLTAIITITRIKTTRICGV